MTLVYETNLHNPLNCSLVHRKIRISVIPAQPTKLCQKGARGLLNSIALKQIIMFFLKKQYQQDMASLEAFVAIFIQEWTKTSKCP